MFPSFLLSGPKLYLIGSAAQARLKSEFNITCLAIIKNVVEDMCFYRGNKNNKWCLFQHKYNCSVSEMSDSYHIPVCGENTYSNWHEMREYVLTIKAISEDDAGLWWCELTKSAVYSNVFLLAINSTRGLNHAHSCNI